MKTFKEYIALEEAKIDDYKAQESSISTEHDPDATIKEPSDIVDHFHTHNPTGDINHTKWVVGQYKKGLIKQEDAPAMKDLLTNFNKFKDKLPKKKIEQYKSHAELQHAIAPHIGTSTSEKQSAQIEKDMNEGTTVVHSTPNMTLRHIHTKEGSIAASKYPDGKRPSWCTAREDSQNMFDHYNSRTGGKFFVAHLPNEKPPFHKLGIGVGASEFQDADNTKLEGKRLQSLVERNPEIKEIPELQGASIHTTKPENVEKHIHDLMDNDPEDTKHVIWYSRFSKDVTYSKKVRSTVDQYDDEMEKAEDEDDSVKNSKFKSVLKTLARGTGNPETLEHLSKHPDDGVKAAVARNYSTPKIVRKQFLDHPNPIVRGSVELRDFPERIRAETVAKETNPSVLAKHVTGDDSIDVQKAALANTNTGSDALANIAHISHHPEIHAAILKHNKTDASVLSSLVRNNVALHNHVEDIVSNPKSDSDTLSYAARTYGSSNKKIIPLVLKHHNTDADTLSSLATNTEQPDIHQAILKHHKVDADTLLTLAINTKQPEFHQAILDHHKVGGWAIAEIAHSTHDEGVIKSIPNNLKTEGGALHQISEKTDDPETQKAIIKHPNVDKYALGSIAKKTDNPEVQKAVIEQPKSHLGIINDIVDKNPSHDVLHHILNNHQGRLTHATMNGIKRGLGSKVPEIYDNSHVTQEHIDSVRNEGKPVATPKKTPTKKLDLFSDDWFKE